MLLSIQRTEADKCCFGNTSLDRAILNESLRRQRLEVGNALDSDGTNGVDRQLSHDHLPIHRQRSLCHAQQHREALELGFQPRDGPRQTFSCRVFHTSIN